MKTLFAAAALLPLAACSSDEARRPSEKDEARFHEIDAMLDEQADQEQGTENAAASQEDMDAMN